MPLTHKGRIPIDVPSDVLLREMFRKGLYNYAYLNRSMTWRGTPQGSNFWSAVAIGRTLLSPDGLRVELAKVMHKQGVPIPKISSKVYDDYKELFV